MRAERRTRGVRPPPGDKETDGAAARSRPSAAPGAGRYTSKSHTTTRPAPAARAPSGATATARSAPTSHASARTRPRLDVPHAGHAVFARRHEVPGARGERGVQNVFRQFQPVRFARPGRVPPEQHPARRVHDRAPVGRERQRERAARQRPLRVRADHLERVRVEQLEPLPPAAPVGRHREPLDRARLQRDFAQERAGAEVVPAHEVAGGRRRRRTRPTRSG